MPSTPMMIWVRHIIRIIIRFALTLFIINFFLASLIPKLWSRDSGTNGSSSFLSLASSGCLSVPLSLVRRVRTLLEGSEYFWNIFIRKLVSINRWLWKCHFKIVVVRKIEILEVSWPEVLSRWDLIVTEWSSRRGVWSGEIEFESHFDCLEIYYYYEDEFFLL